MPFVQRVVSPTFISRSRPRVRVRGAGPVSPVPSKGTSAGSCGGSGPLLTSAGNAGEPSSSSDVIGNGTISGAVIAGTAASSITGKSGSGSSLNERTTSSPSPVVNGYEFDSVTNITLSNALRQLASLVLIANDIFTELNKELQTIGDRSKGIKLRIDSIGQKVEECDPKLVTVPESDLETFVHIKNHFKSNRPIDKELFTPQSRSTNLRELYEAAAKTPISSIRDASGSEFVDRDAEFLCTPVLGQAHRKMRTRVDVEIETRMPAAVEELRKWTSTEALGDITVTPDCISRVGHHNTSMNNSTFCNSNINGHSNISTGTQPGVSMDVTDDISTVIATTTTIQQQNSNNNNYTNNRTANEDVDLPLDHRLPSPEEQCQIIALRYPADVITVDITGRRFERMCNARKSMTNYMAIGDQNNLNEDVQTIKRRSRSRKPRGKRRNTIAGTDQKEIEEAANGELGSNSSPTTELAEAAASSKVGRSKSSDILKTDSPLSLANTTENGKTTLTRFNSLKQWGRNRLRLINRSDEKKDKVLDVDHENNVYETVVSKNKKKFAEKERKLSHERKPSYSSSEKSSLSLMSHSAKTTSGVVGTAASINPVKMRESSSLRRQRRSGLDQKDEPHSSSGNWSASSESGRTSIGSEITVQPKSSASSTSLNHSNLHSGSGPPSSIISRRRFLNTSASSSVTSEGTATPDLQMHDLYYDDETSSAYSCDTEGYYTSFHVDSGLKTLKEEEPMTPLHSTSALSSNNSFSSSINQTVLTAENEYELFGRGSTSTTTSSAGTVCTTLLAADNDKSSIHGPAVPERKSSLTKLNRSNSNTSTSTLERSYSSSTVGSTLERTGTIKRNGVLLQKEVAAIIHQEKKESPSKPSRVESPDSGNNTSSSPIETNSNDSPTQGLRSNSEFEYSECSDLEGVDRIERIRVKTAINSSRIPSMCIITPTTSDDETMKDFKVQSREKLELPTTPPPQETDLDAIEYEKDASTNGNQQRVQIINVNKATGYAAVHHHQHHPHESQKPSSVVELRKDANFNNFRKTTLQPLNTMLGKLKGVLPHLKKSPNKESTTTTPSTTSDSLYDTAGEYVTIADVRNNNNNHHRLHPKQRTSNGIYYSNDIVKRNLATVLSGNLNHETEYVSLNELPGNIRCDSTTNMLPSSHHQSIPAPLSKEIDAKNHQRDGSSRSEGAEPGTTAPKTHDNDGEKHHHQQQQQEREQEQHHQVRGARVQFDAQGKVVYNSDSLKRRKGAHTTFAPGPCVKDPAISALSSTSVTASTLSASVAQTTVPNLIPRSPLISGCLNRKQEIVVRPVVSQKPQIAATAATNNVDMMTKGALSGGRYIREKSQPQHIENGNLIKSSHPSAHQHHHRPQFEEDYQLLSPSARQHPKQFEPNRPTPLQGRYSSSTGPPAGPFQRNNHIYWTLQHRRQPTTSPALPKDDINVAKGNTVNLDDLYATPNKNRNREAGSGLKTTPLGFSTFFSPIKTAENEPLKISPIDPRNVGGFKTSTPSKINSSRTESPTKVSLADELRNRLHIQEGTRSHNASPTSSGRSTPLRGFLEQQQPRSRHSWAPETPELPKTCSDRMGTQKTSLMDFKKLLLAKSSKHTPNAKLSAVELLKLNKNEVASPSTSPTPALNTSMNILELSGSPKTFANRRAIRQGNFGSPSKTLGSKQRTAWRMNTSRTDVMSTAIPEANSEEDSSGSNGSMGRRSPQAPITAVLQSVPEKTIIDENLNLKTNIFLQSEENNFMRGELKKNPTATLGISRTQLAQARAQFLMGTKNINPNKEQISDSYKTTMTKRIEETTIPQATTNDLSNSTINDDSNNEIKNNPAAPSLETAL